MAGDILKFKKPQKKEVNFKIFAGEIQRGDIEEASSSLELLFGFESAKCIEIAEYVCKKFQENPSTLMGIMLIREQLELGRMNAALSQIQSSFGLVGPDSLVALQKMEEILKKQ